MHVKSFIIIISIICSTLTISAEECRLEGVGQSVLGSKMATIYSIRFSREGLAANWFFNVVRHNKCPGEGVCKWIFTHCKGNEYILESKHYRGSYLYANIANAVSHYSTDKNSACQKNAFRWKVWFDKCSSNYYLQNTQYGDWLDASDAGLVKHTACKTNEMNGWNQSCKQLFLFLLNCSKQQTT